MVSLTEVKLLTLLNVTAIKKPFEMDVPGGHRGSPALGGRSASASTSKAGANGEKTKRRKSVVFGGEVGPSGSTFAGKRKRAGGDMGVEVEDGPSKKNTAQANGNGHAEVRAKAAGLEVEEEMSEDEGKGRAVKHDTFSTHFAEAPPQLTDEAIAQADEGNWSVDRKLLSGFGRVAELQPGRQTEGSTASSSSSLTTKITPSLMSQIGESATDDPLFSTALSQLGTYKDIYLHSLDGEAEGTEKKLFGEQKEAMRKAAVVHALNHVLKTRRKIIRNNEKLAHAAAAGPNAAIPDSPRDQSFTRPKVLLLLPLRSIALHYLTAHLLPLAPPGTQIENQRPFINSFSIPSDSTDPLASTSAVSQFPIDHLVNFRGNSDDNFRFGIKITRKAWRIVMMPANEAKLMDCDILIGSPLGFKMMAEKEGSTDLLGSLEIVVADSLDVMMMQNWDHVQQYLFQHMSLVPESPHGCDFSRVKPWYLDKQAKYIRQTILLSRYDSPEARALFSHQCHNLAGKVRTEKADYEGVMTRVREGVKQTFERVDMDLKGGEGAVEEVEKRLAFFTKKTIPALLRSAVSRQNTLIIIPSYFDFVRITHFLRKNQLISFAAISEYSSNSEISRARTLFFKGKKPFLLMTERFHFYRRYRIRGAKTIVWYQPPEHAQFYSETLETPFLPSQGGGAAASGASEDGEAEVDEGEVSARVLWSKFDKLRLERIVGGANWRRMIGSGEGKAEFL
ncbi:uncharacterized protein MKK02DRAFT_23689 [Dioszegia hungarica]|uniref:U3 small nucleolar RNA-associated protein 25 n=1 Tax=Dioszegia hungarica TaxID=4972 RepID=A0AA38LXJ2_9TREE|nr:uncharacterized protein MKK02DRAFT_23689 [Dioszegia hungarica]KAI9637456.1 hypothetical protein MKK02DRAFT_23689 [Dioszegia hungarica]